MTGGLEPYVSSMREITNGAVNKYSVFENGLAALKMNSVVLYNFIVCDIGAAFVFLIFCLYHMLRSGRLAALQDEKSLFFLLWGLPSFLFYLFIAVAPGVPGYALILLPPLLLISARAIIYFIDETKFMTGRNIAAPLILSLIFVNLYLFFFAIFNVSYPTIKEHDRSLSLIRDSIRVFDPSNTVLFVRHKIIFFGLSHTIYYLPEFMSYDPDYSLPGRKRFAGVGGSTILSDEIVLPATIQNFATLMYQEEIDLESLKKNGLSAQPISMNIFPPMYIISGPLSEIQKVYPGLMSRIVRHPSVLRRTWPMMAIKKTSRISWNGRNPG
jgi:hypothetical protein